jgi:hypothetical protein
MIQPKPGEIGFGEFFVVSFSLIDFVDFLVEEFVLTGANFDEGGGIAKDFDEGVSGQECSD